MPDLIAHTIWATLAGGAIAAAVLIDHRTGVARTTRALAAAAVVPWRAWQWRAASSWWRHQAAAAWRAGADLTSWTSTAAAWPEPGSQDRCPRCRGRRCRPHREGLDCGGQHAPGLTTTLAGTGEHQAIYRQPVGRGWSPLPLATRVRLAPTAWAARLGRPVQLGLGRAIGGVTA